MQELEMFNSNYETSACTRQWILDLQKMTEDAIVKRYYIVHM
jgi:hypothetical protein